MKVELRKYPEFSKTTVVLLVEGKYQGFSYIGYKGKLVRSQDLLMWLKNYPMPEILAHAERLLIIKNI